VFPLFDLLPFLLPIGAACYLIWVRWTRGGDPKRDSTTIQYDPPDRLTPAECVALLENDLDMCGITATLVDLSVRGYLSINANQPRANSRGAGGSADNVDYLLHLVKSPDEWQSLKPHERSVLSAIFLPGNPLRLLPEIVTKLKEDGTHPVIAGVFSRLQAKVEENPGLRALSEAKADPQPDVSLSDLRGNFFAHVPMIRVAVFDALHAGGYYVRRPDQMRAGYLAVGVFVGVVMAAIGGLLMSKGVESLPTALSGVLTALIICVFGWIMPARSPAGARALGKIRGFQNFLGRVEKDRIERLEKTPQLFERYLPYAMALRVDTRWSQAFAGITLRPQEGYKPKPGEAVLHEQLVQQLMAIPVKKAAQ